MWTAKQMIERKKYDCIVIGGGHNGLVAAAYLARAGKSVCVLERRHVLGGCAATEPLWPGYKVSTAAYVISLLSPDIIRELRLKHYGLNILPRNPSSFTPLLDGRSLLLGPDKRQTRAEIAKFSPRDADRYPQYEAVLERVAAVLEPALSRTAPDPLPMPAEWRKIGLAKRLRLDFSREGARFRARREIARIFEPWFATRMLAEIRQIFDEHGVTWAPYRSVRDTIEHDPDCSSQNPMFSMVDQPGIGTYLMPGSPLAFSEVERLPARRAPLLGEHTDEILLDTLGMSEAEVGRLHDQHIVAGPATSGYNDTVD